MSEGDGRAAACAHPADVSSARRGHARAGEGECHPALRGRKIRDGGGRLCGRRVRRAGTHADVSGAGARQRGRVHAAVTRAGADVPHRDLIEEADGFLVLSYKGLRYPVEIVSRKQNEYEILLNGVAYTFSVETPFSLKRKKILASRQSDLATIIIKSPMPGKILDVQVDNGQEINKGDTLLILEAMKMQNIITATHRGRISRLCVKTGQIVGKDEILAEIKL